MLYFFFSVNRKNIGVIARESAQILVRFDLICWVWSRRSPGSYYIFVVLFHCFALSSGLGYLLYLFLFTDHCFLPGYF